MTDQATEQAAQPAEPSMAEYAKMREAEMRGDKPTQEVKAEVVEETKPAEATDEAAPAEEVIEADETTTESATEGEGEQVQAQSKKGLNKRFSELTAEKKAAQALAEQRAAELEQARKEVEQAKAEAERLRLDAERAQNSIPQVPEEANDPLPNRNDFDDPDLYVAALSAHASRQEIRKAQLVAKQAAEARATEAAQKAQEAQQAAAQRQIQELHTAFQKRVAEVKPEYPDYAERVEQNESLQLRNDVFFAIEKSQDAPHILYHIATNPDVAESLNKLPPVDALIRIGELQAELRVARKPKPSKAAEPIKPIGNRSSPLPKTPNEESMAEFAARREREMKQEAIAKRSAFIR